jgi:WD40 repeat protein
MWDYSIGTRKNIPESGMWSYEFSRDDKYLATGHADGVTRIWSLPDLDVIAALSDLEDNEEARISAVAFSHDNAFLAVGSGWNSDGKVRVWKLFESKPRVTIKNLDGPVMMVSFGNEAAYVLCNVQGQLDMSTGLLNGMMHIWKTSNAWRDCEKHVEASNYWSPGCVHSGQFVVGIREGDDCPRTVEHVAIWETSSLRKAVNAIPPIRGYKCRGDTLVAGSEDSLLVFNVVSGESQWIVPDSSFTIVLMTMVVTAVIFVGLLWWGKKRHEG